MRVRARPKPRKPGKKRMAGRTSLTLPPVRSTGERGGGAEVLKHHTKKRETQLVMAKLSEKKEEE